MQCTSTQVKWWIECKHAAHFFFFKRISKKQTARESKIWEKRTSNVETVLAGLVGKRRKEIGVLCSITCARNKAVGAPIQQLIRRLAQITVLQKQKGKPGSQREIENSEKLLHSRNFSSIISKISTKHNQKNWKEICHAYFLIHHPEIYVLNDVKQFRMVADFTINVTNLSTS